jgi:hypothetical protein
LRRTPLRSQRGGGLPPLLVFLLGVALVFGTFYVFQGVQMFFRTGGLGVEEATRQAQIVASATRSRATRAVAQVTPMATATPQPTCTDFRVIVPSAIVRENPSANAAVITGFAQGTIVCVLWRDPGSEWYTIDRDSETRRRELAYMHESVIEALNPTPTLPPTVTPLPITATLPPTVTPLPSLTPEVTPPSEQPTRRFAPSATPNMPDNIPTLPPTPTPMPMQDA